jgi:hypothetical protein
MARKRKTADVFEIRGDYGHGFEMVTAEVTLKEARAQLRTYRANEPGIPFKIVKVREPKVREPIPAPPLVPFHVHVHGDASRNTEVVGSPIRVACTNAWPGDER